MPHNSTKKSRLSIHKSQSKRTIYGASRQAAFALVTALSLMAFVLLLLLSMSTLVQVESTRASGTQSKIKAEQNAYNAALIALSELQKHCGVDQRSTASAGITDTDSSTPAVEGVEHPQWMGVWRFDKDTQTKALETWLISGNQDKTSTNLLDPVAALAQPSVGLPVSPFANSAYVEVPIVYMDADNKSDGFAYWVSGQQEKADVGIALPADPLPTAIEGAEVLGGQYSLPALAFDSPGLDPRDPALAKISALSELPLIDGVDTTQLEGTAAALAAGNYGLLTNARDGGLKTDLTSQLETVAVDDTTPWVDFTPYTNPDGTPIPNDAYTTASPSWGKLKAFYNLKETMQDDGQLTPQPSTDAQPGISPRIAMCSFGVASGTEADKTIELLLQPKVVLHNPYNVPLAPKEYMINFFGLSPRSDSAGTRAGRIVCFNNYDYYWENEDGFTPGRYRRQNSLDLRMMHLVDAGAARQSVADHGVLTRQRADGPRALEWNATTGDYPPGAPRFKIDCNVVLQPGEAMIFSPPPDLVPGQRNPFDRMAPVTPDVALTPGDRDFYYRYPTSPNWRMFAKDEDNIVTYKSGGQDWYRVRLYGGSEVEYFDATLSVLETDTDEMGQDVAALFYHNGERRPYVARQQNTGFEDRIFQTTGRIEINTSSDFIGDNIFIYYSDSHPVNPGANTVAWHALAYDSFGPPNDQVYNPYKYFNPRAKIMERSALKTRRDNTRGAHAAVADPTENYFYEAEISSVDPSASGFVVLDTYDSGDGSGESKVRIGGGLRSPIADTMVFYDVPSDATGLYSLGQLQHFQLSDYFDEAGYAIGNSLRSPHLAADQLFHAGLGVISWLDPANAVEGTVDYSTIDLSYVFNDALWDRYFFSTTAQLTQTELDAGTPLPNPRMQPIGAATLADLQDPDKAAANLMVRGAFNVNSTSVEAWKALLAGNHKRYEGDDGSPLESPFFRFFSQDLSQDNELSSGYSSVALADASDPAATSPLDALAEAIVEQVKLRGPFASLAEFVNRKRILDPSDDPSLNASGALQAAIDKSGLNAAIAVAQSVPTEPEITGFADFMPSYPLEGSSLEGLPGMLSQADVLTAIGPFLTARSDTFTITSYGEHSKNGNTVSALLEMTVQRMPDYVDSNNAASVHPDDPAMLVVNKTFGRRFIIVSTRWLDSNQVQ